MREREGDGGPGDAARSESPRTGPGVLPATATAQRPPGWGKTHTEGRRE